MADFFKGLTGGFQTGLQFGQQLRQRRMEDDLAQEAGRYGVTEGAYGPGLQENIQQLQVLRERDPAQAAAYDQAIGELTRRQGLTAPDYSVASGPTNFATRQEARQAAAPLRAEGLAGVYRQYGDVAKADELEARAFDQQRAIAREARDVKAFDTAQAAAQQQGLLTGAQLTDIQRKQNLQAALDLRLADINSQTFEKPEMRTQAVLSLVEELQGPQAAAQLRESYSKDELTQISLQAKKFDEGFRQSRAKGVIPALEWFDEQNTSFKLERDPKNPFRVIQVNTDGSRTLFADAKNERELGMIIDAKAKPGGFLELAKFDLDQKKAEAAIRASNATTVSAQQSPVEKNIAGLKRLGVNVTPAMVESLAGLDKADSPRLKAQLDVITSAVKEGTLKPEEGLKRVNAVFTDFQKEKQASRDQTEIVGGIKDEAKKGNLPQLINYLKTERGYTDAALAPLFAEAGVKMPASTISATPVAAAQSNVGLTRPQAASYVPPAGSRAAIAQEARSQATATQAESARLAAQAQTRLATDFAADARTLNPVELVRKYDKVRGQLPRDQALELQVIQRNIR